MKQKIYLIYEFEIKWNIHEVVALSFCSYPVSAWPVFTSVLKKRDFMPMKRVI